MRVFKIQRDQVSLSKDIEIQISILAQAKTNQFLVFEVIKFLRFKMILDFHNHIGSGDAFYHSSEDEKLFFIPPEKLLDEMGKFNVAKSVVIPNFQLPHKLMDANLRLDSSIKNFKDKLFPFAWLDPRIEGVCKQLETLVKKYHFKGLKLHPALNGFYLTNKSVEPLIEKSINLRIPILIHTGWSPLASVNLVDNLAGFYPDAKIVMAHMFDPNCIGIAKKNENVFIETSYATHPRRIEQAVRVIGAEKLIYGSDFPMGGGMEFEISKIRLAKIKDKEKEKIFSKNALSLLGID